MELVPLHIAKLRHVYKTLEYFGWNRTKALNVLIISERTLKYHIEEMRDAGIHIPSTIGRPKQPSTIKKVIREIDATFICT